MLRWKRLLSLLLCLVMVLSFFPTAALAEGEGDAVILEDERDHEHEHEGEDQESVPPEIEETVGGDLESPDGEPAEESVEADAPGGPEDEEPAEDEKNDLVRVEFICDPEDAVITVYDPSQLDENGEPLVIAPEEDGTWLLTPGEYWYDAECDGYENLVSITFKVKESGDGENSQNIQVILTEELLSEDEIVSVPGREPAIIISAISNGAWTFVRQDTYSNVYGLHDSGCGIFALVNAVGYLTGNNMNVEDVASWALQGNGYSTSEGTVGSTLYPRAISQYGKTYGFTGDGKEIWAGWGSQQLKNHLIAGGVAVGHVPGHFIAIIGYNQGTNQYHVLDSYPTNARATKSGEGDVWRSETEFNDNMALDRYYLFSSTTPSYLSKCTSYPTYGTVRMSKACNPYTLPCNAETAKKYNCTSTALTNKALKAGDTVVVTGIVYNTEKHYWYKVDLDKNGSVAYVYADNANISSFSYECPWVYNSSFPSTITGATWLSGSILTGGSELVSIQGMVLNGDTTDISKRSNVYNSSAISCSGTSYSLKGSAVDTGLAFQNLAEGQYYTLIYQVKVKHYKLTSATAISSAETHTYICKDKCFYRAAAGAHVHDKGTYMYYWSSHPHYKCYKCSSCGTIWEDRNETVQLPNCESCRPGKPAFIGLEGTHLANEPVVFSWNETDRTTHYNIWVYKQNTSGEYVAVDHTFYVNSGYELALEPGRYKALVQAYNSNLWESDNSDWVHTESDPTYFIVEQVTYTITYNANGGTGAPAAQTKTHDVALTLSSTKPTRANASAGSYTVTLNTNGGSVSTDKLTAARTTSYTFKNWNTAANGGGTSYNPGASYTANAAATLYAQWNSSTTTAAVTLPTPTRTGYSFQGWATSASATDGSTGNYTPTGNVTLYAIWKQDQTTEGTLSLGTARGSAGSEVVLEVKLDKNPGIMMLSFRLDYDKSKLQFLGGEDGSLTDWTFSTTGSGALWDGDKDYKATGTIVKLRFKILDNAKEGDVVVNFTAVEAWNYSEREILFGANAGKVTISNRIPGDVTGDGKVNGMDLVRLRKYLAGDSVEIDLSNADVTGDGKVNGMDLIRLRKFLAGDNVILQ